MCNYDIFDKTCKIVRIMFENLSLSFIFASLKFAERKLKSAATVKIIKSHYV